MVMGSSALYGMPNLTTDRGLRHDDGGFEMNETFWRFDDARCMHGTQRKLSTSS